MKKYGIDAEYEINKSLKQLTFGKVYGIDAAEELTRLLQYYLDPKNILREERREKLKKLNGKK